jgi:histone H3/H4
MANNQPLTSKERLEIVEVLRKGNLSHRAIAQQFNRAQSTISSIARDAGITPSHRRRRTPAARDVEITYDKQERINFQDRFIGVLDGMLTDGGLSPREAREVAQASKVVFDARRAEDIEPSEAHTNLSPQELEKKGFEGLTPQELEKQGWVEVGLGDVRIHPDTVIGRELLEAGEKAEREWLEKQGHPGEEYGSS